MTSHVAGLAVMKCEADATGKLPCGTVLSILGHHLQSLTAQIHLLTYLAQLLFSAGEIQDNFHQTLLNNGETRPYSTHKKSSFGKT